MESRISARVQAALLVPLSAFVTALALWCQPNEMQEVFAAFQQKPVLFLLNFLPVALCMAGLSLILRNVFWGAGAVNAVVCLLSIVNRVKIEIRDEPLFPRDFALYKEAGDALDAYHLQLPVPELALAGGVTLFLFVLGAVMRRRPERRRRGFRGKRAQSDWRVRLCGAAVCFALLVALILTVYASDTLYNSLEPSNPYRLSAVFNETGFPYNFCRHFTTYLVERPKGYDRAQAQAWDEASTGYDPADAKNVNVVMVMNEAFSDVTDGKAFAFTPDNDPLANLHALQSDPHTLSLRLVVPGFAGGTANTEFDVFTGMQTNAIGAGTTSAMRTVNRNIDTLFRVFNADGYRTMFVHPGNAWFYNRENVYNWFGASETRFIEDMDAPEYKGNWVADDDLAGRIERDFRESVEDGTPIFHASTTIQNHMGYPYSKYGDGYEYRTVPLNVDVTPETREALEVYAEGVRDADRMLGRLWAYFAERQAPTLLVFYGDHLPCLDNAYEELGMADDAFTRYETPCVIWANDPAAALLDWDTLTPTLGLPDNGRLSASFLGALLLDLTGRGHATPWAEFLNGLRRTVPVVQNGTWMLSDGSVVDARSMEASTVPEQVRQWRQWSYYRLQQKEWRG